MTTGQAEAFDLELRSGRIHAERRRGAGPAVLCLPGLSANLRSFDVIAGLLAGRGFDVIALDLRGRGRSETTPPGTYGWPAHAADAAEVVERLGARPVHVIGWSMGAFVAMQLARSDPHLLRKVVLIDACARTSPPAKELIRAAISRLGVVYPSFERYLGLVRQLGTITPWGPLWERYFAYELEGTQGGVRARTSPGAVLEDFDYGASHDPAVLWPALTMPVLLVRALRPLVPGGPFIVGAGERDSFATSVTSARVVEVDANHYGVMTHSRTFGAILEFLSDAAPGGGVEQ